MEDQLLRLSPARLTTANIGLRVPRRRPRAAPLEVGLGELLHGDVPQEAGGTQGDPAGGVGSDL